MATLLHIPGFADPFSSLSHLIGAAVFAWLGVRLIKRGWKLGDEIRTRHHGQPYIHGGAWREVSLLVFAFASVFLLSMSGVYHMLPPATASRAVLQRLDHAGIFILIAGTFTPVHAILFRGVMRWGMLAFVWLFAIGGVTLKTVYFNSTPLNLGLAVYLGMGWVGGLSMFMLARREGLRLVMTLILGGLAYTGGASLEYFQPRPLIPAVVGSHELFHVLVLIGLGFHWRFVWATAGWTAARGMPVAGDSRPPSPVDLVMIRSETAAISGGSESSVRPPIAARSPK